MAIPLLGKSAADQFRFVKRRGEVLQAHAKARHDAAREWQRIYLGWTPPRGANRANVHVPRTFATVETVIPRMMAQVIGLPYSPIQVKGREPADEPKTVPVNALLWWRIQQDRVLRTLDAIVRSAVKFGNGWWQVIPKTTRTTAFRRVPDQVFFDTAISLKETTEQRLLTRPHVQYLDYFHVWPDDQATGFGNDEIYDVVWEFWLRQDQVETLQQQGVFAKDVSLNYRAESGPPAKDDRLPFLGATDGLDQSAALLTEPEAAIPRLRCWRYETDAYFLVIAPDQHDAVLMAIANPYWHQRKTIGCVPYTPVEGSAWAVGIIEHLESLQKELDDKRNQRLDIVNLIINPAVKVLRGSPAFREEKDFALWPGRRFTVNGPDDITAFALPDTARPTAEEEDRLRFDMQDASGVNDFIQGLQGRREITATEVDLKTRNAANRFVYAFQLTMDAALREPAELILALDQQFLSTPEVVRIAGSAGTNWPRVTPEVIQGGFDLYSILDPTREDLRVRFQQILNAGQFLRDSPNLDRLAFERKLVQALDLNPMELLRPGIGQIAAAGLGAPAPAAPGQSAPAPPAFSAPETELDALRGVTQPDSAVAL